MTKQLFKMKLFPRINNSHKSPVPAVDNGPPEIAELFDLPVIASPQSHHSIPDRRKSLERRDESEKIDVDMPAMERHNGTEVGVLVSSVHPRCYLIGMGRFIWSMEDYRNVKLLSVRNSCLVLRAVCKHSRRPVVIKQFDTTKLTPMSRIQQEREVRIHSTLSHHNVVNFLAAFKQHDQLNIVLEYANDGNLYDYVIMREKIKPLSEDEIRTAIAIPLLHALEYIHGLDIIHRDIKLENVLIHDGVIKLADFGVAINLSEERAVTRVGTLNYLSPEVLKCPFKKEPQENKDSVQIGGYDVRADIWSFGVLIYECLNNASPYTTNSRQDTEALIASGSLPVFLNKTRSDLAVDFVYKCLSLDPNDRPSASELLQHPWLA